MTAYASFEKEINFANEEAGRFFEVLAHASGMNLKSYPYDVTDNSRMHFASKIEDLRHNGFLFSFEEDLFERGFHPVQEALAQMNCPKWHCGVPFDFTAQHNKAFYFALTEAGAFHSIRSVSYFGIADIRTIRTLLMIRRQRGIPLDDPDEKFSIECMDMVSRWGMGYEWDGDGDNRLQLPYWPGWFNCVDFLGEGSLRGDMWITDWEGISSQIFAGSDRYGQVFPKLIISTLSPSVSIIPNKAFESYQWLRIEKYQLTIGLRSDWEHASTYTERISQLRSLFLG